jgi:RNA polymerase sigma factor (TIGR02999 family)
MSRNANAADITGLCEQIARGDSGAHDQLITLVYVELQEIARKMLGGERADISLQTGDLVDAAYLKLVAADEKAFKRNRAYFFGAVAQAMRQILIDRARKPILPLSRTPPDDIPDGDKHQDGRMIALDNALNELARHNPRAARVVEFRFFAGMTVNAVAEVLDISASTVERDFYKARAFLFGKDLEYLDND